MSSLNLRQVNMAANSYFDRSNGNHCAVAVKFYSCIILVKSSIIVRLETQEGWTIHH